MALHSNVALAVRCVALLLGTNLLVLGLLLVYYTLRTITQALVFSPRGLKVKRGGFKHFCEWKDLTIVRRTTLNEGLTNILGLGAVYDVASIEFANGVVIQLGPAMRFRARLLSIAERKIARANLAGLLESITHGASVKFNSVTLTPVSIEIHGRRIPWNAVDRVDVLDSDAIVISARNGLRCFLKVGKLPNPTLFLSVAKVLALENDQ
jgi:hypothetical protein